MRTSDFDYYLPPGLIAQEPIGQRDRSRLLVLYRKTGMIEHRQFREIKKFLTCGDALVLNNTRVIPARLIGVRKDTGGTVELLLLRRHGKDEWEALSRPGRKVRLGSTLIFGDKDLEAEVVYCTPYGGRVVHFKYKGIFEEVLSRLGQIPLPPYIKKELHDWEKYQTVFSKVEGSAAAPTAGLHFTRELIDELKDLGVKIVYLTLHIGLDTFRPVEEEYIEDHPIHCEYFYFNETAAKDLNGVKEAGKRIIAVGTTSCRVLETVVDEHGYFSAHEGWTKLFIRPGFTFRGIDALITNFHLPRSTLIMLISAFAGRNNILNAYQEAIKRRYRFYSFGDSMLIL